MVVKICSWPNGVAALWSNTTSAQLGGLSSRLRKFLISSFLLLLGLCSGYAHSQTAVSGVISSDVVWRAAASPFVVTSDILVQSGATLSIEPGVTIFMGSNTRLTVQAGTLKAIGTAQAPIRFTSQKLQMGQTPAKGDWQQLTLSPGSTSATRLEYVQLEYGSGVVLAGASPTLNHLTIKSNQGAAITVDLASSPIGSGNQATGNDINAIVVPSGEIAGAVIWGVRGIPYLVSSGVVSVGTAPKITAISPSGLQRGETQQITLAGTRLTGLTSPTFDLTGVAVQLQAGGTDTQVQLQVSAAADAALGPAILTAQTAAGMVTVPNALTISAVQPKLTSVAPATIYTEQGDVPITLRGQNFNPQAVAHLDSLPLVTTYVDVTQLTAIVPNQTSNSVKSITLRSPNPEGGGALESNAQVVSIVTLPPTVTSVLPNSLRRGETRSIVVVGSGLSAATLSLSSGDLSVSDLTLTRTQASFNLTATANATLGTQQVTFSNSAGSAVASIRVNPVLPTASVTPTPIAIPPDSSARQFAIQLSYADTVEHSFTVVSADSTTVKVSAANLTIAAGQTQVIGNISGLKNGVTSLTLTSPTMGVLTLPVYVTADFLGLNTSTSPLLGVVLTPPIQPPTNPTSFAFAGNLGVVYGNFVRAVSPRAFATDVGTATLRIEGEGLQGAVSVTVKPADGVTTGSLVVAADGKSVTVPLNIAVDAPVSQRQIILSSATGAYPVADPDVDRILITYPRPEILSIDPLFATPGTSIQTILIRGRNLQGIESLEVSPAQGITFGAAPVANADGTQLTAVANITAAAALGQRVITAVSPASSSDSTPSAANTLTLVSSIVNPVTPIASAQLGVHKLEVPAAQPTQNYDIPSPLVGVVFGSAATSISPAAKAIGETFMLTVQGVGLQAVTGVSFAPATGITLGVPVVAADGKSLTVEVSVAADAPQMQYALRLVAGSTRVEFVSPAKGVFTVTAPQPVIEIVDPKALQLGAPAVLMTIRGQNFQNASAVRLQPANGVTVGSLTVVDQAATLITVSISAESTAVSGPRAVIVTTPGGETSADLSVANTVNLGGTIATTGLVAPLLGVVKLDANVQPTTTTSGPFVASQLGVVLQEPPAPATTGQSIATPLGVAFGATPLAVSPRKMPVGSTGTLTVTGLDLEQVTAISLSPPEDVTLGTPLQIAADGKQVSVPFTVAAGAAMTARKVILSAGTNRLNFADTASASVQITSDQLLPVSSISPILGTTGTMVTLIVRGQNLQGATAVTATPSTGLVFDTQPTVNGDGTELTVRLQITDDAALGARVIQVVTPVATSSPVQSPANRFTVYAP